MTGEITLRGSVLPVGGLKEKLLAARRAGIESVILPGLNRKELDEVPARVRRGLTLHLVDGVEEVLALAMIPPRRAARGASRAAGRAYRSRRRPPRCREPGGHRAALDPPAAPPLVWFFAPSSLLPGGSRDAGKAVPRLKILLIGDIVGSPGRKITRRALPRVFAEHDIDYCVANAENAAGGFGVTREVCDELLDLGIDVLTSGNHIWDKREIIPFMDDFPQLLRPANYPAEQPGTGTHVGRGKRSGVAVATLNVSGRVFMNGSIDDPSAAPTARSSASEARRR